MSFFHVQNLTEQTLHEGVAPWDFKPTETLTAQIRLDKTSRQEWYQSASTRHFFYTGVEPINPRQRPSKEANPPFKLHAFCVDYDAKIPDSRVEEVVICMKNKPEWIERSLGGGVRLVFTLPAPLLVDTYEFCSFVLTRAVKWLNLGMLPGLDEPAFVDPVRTLCNGCEWRTTGHGALSASALQGFYVDCAREFRSKLTDGPDIPLTVIEAALRSKYPRLDWPTDFALETQGPSFWIEGSESPKSAIVKSGGLFTFSGHAAKAFYSWADLLGAAFVADYATNAIAKATTDVWFDGNKFWRRKKGAYAGVEMTEMMNFLTNDCGLSTKPDKSGKSQTGQALSHLYNECSVESAVPAVFRPTGLWVVEGCRRLNLYVNRAVLPAGDASEWGDGGKFPFLSRLLDRLFSPVEQLPFFLAWWKHYHQCAVDSCPRPGQNCFLMGGVGVGKTLLNRRIVGKSVGGHADASNYLVNGGDFNGYLLGVPHWCVDDEGMSENESSRTMFQVALKRHTANPSIMHNEKFVRAGMTEWMGRTVVTTNLDFVSRRALGDMGVGDRDKTNLFRCSTYSEADNAAFFPDRKVLEDTIDAELPFFLGWLAAHEPPAQVLRDTRFGYRAFHEASLMEQAHQGSRSAPFLELLIDVLNEYFSTRPEATEWRGTGTQLTRLLHSNPLNAEVIRSLRMEQVSRHLETIERGGRLKCHAENDANRCRVWVFPRINPPDRKCKLAVLPAANHIDFQAHV